MRESASPLTFIAGTVVATTLCPAVGAQSEPSRDKTGYHLFNPVPRELLRPLSADRPDTTESPYTVDAGHVQIESSVIDWAREGDDDTLTFASANFKIGLWHNIDLQLVTDPYVRIDNDIDGFGDTQLRLKVNLWGNDGGSTAMALMPFIKFPTAGDDLGNDEIEGGLIVPLAIDLAEGVGLGLMAEFDAAYDEDDDDHDLLFVHTAVLGFDVTEQVGAFIEFVGETSSDSGSPYRASAGVGVTWLINQDLQLDCGVNIGLNDAVDDFNPFVGFTVRF